MIPAAFPGLPSTVFPGLLVPSIPAALGGMSAVDITAAVAAVVWALGGLIALRIAIAMSRDADRPPRKTTHGEPTTPRGFRDAA